MESAETQGLAPSPQSEAVTSELQELSLQPAPNQVPLQERKNGETVCHSHFMLSLSSNLTLHFGNFLLGGLGILNQLWWQSSPRNCASKWNSNPGVNVTSPFNFFDQVMCVTDRVAFASCLVCFCRRDFSCRILSFYLKSHTDFSYELLDECSITTSAPRSCRPTLFLPDEVKILLKH